MSTRPSKQQKIDLSPTENVTNFITTSDRKISTSTAYDSTRVPTRRSSRTRKRTIPQNSDSEIHTQVCPEFNPAVPPNLDQNSSSSPLKPSPSSLSKKPTSTSSATTNTEQKHISVRSITQLNLDVRMEIYSYVGLSEHILSDPWYSQGIAEPQHHPNILAPPRLQYDSERQMYAAAQLGDMEVLEHITSVAVQKCKDDPRLDRHVVWCHWFYVCWYKGDLCATMARCGHIQALAWTRGWKFKWDGRTCVEAARGGHGKVLHWLRQNQCPQDSYIPWITAAAAAGGHLKLLKEEGHAANMNPKTCSAAVAAGHFEILKWLRRPKTLKCSWDADTCEAAARNGHLDILQYARNRNCPWDYRTACAAARGGYLDVLIWARKHGCIFDWKVSCAAARGGHFEVLQWVWNEKCGHNAMTTFAASEGGHLDLLKWLRRRKCVWDENTCTAAALYGHLEVLQWVRKNKCPWDKHTCIAAAIGGHMEILQYASQNGCPWGVDVCAAAAARGHLHVLEWLRKERCPWDNTTCYAAAKFGHANVLQWAQNNGCPCNQDDMAFFWESVVLAEYVNHDVEKIKDEYLNYPVLYW